MTTPFSHPLLVKLASRDRALFSRLAVDTKMTPAHRRVWHGVTHLGGARVSIGTTLALYPIAGPLACAKTALALLLSHLLVSVVKRNAGRARPAVTMLLDGYPDAPDQFSFPSGHSSAALSVAISTAVLFPAVAIPVLCLALIIGASRVVIGVHYPGDVVAGQLISILIAALVFQ